MQEREGGGERGEMSERERKERERERARRRQGNEGALEFFSPSPFPPFQTPMSTTTVRDIILHQWHLRLPTAHAVVKKAIKKEGVLGVPLVESTERYFYVFIPKEFHFAFTSHSGTMAFPVLHLFVTTSPSHTTLLDFGENG